MGKDKQRQSGRDVGMSEGEKKNGNIKRAKKEKKIEKQRDKKTEMERNNQKHRKTKKGK